MRGDVLGREIHLAACRLHGTEQHGTQQAYGEVLELHLNLLVYT